MNILFIISDLEGGGTQKVISQIANYLVKRKDHVTICTLEKTKEKFELDNKISRIRINSCIKKFPFSSIILNLIKIKNLNNVLRKNEFDIIISFIHTTNVISIISSIFTKRKVIISERNDYEAQSLPFFWKILRKITYNFALCLTANSIKTKNILKKKFDKEVFLLPNPVFLPEKVNRKKREKIILSIGRLVDQKNYYLLLDSFKDFAKSFNEWIFVIIGEGYEYNFIKKRIKELNLDQKIFLKKFCNPTKYYQTSSFFVHGSRFEGTPNVLLESMAHGLPIITSNYNGVCEIINNKKTGLIFDLDKQNDLLAKMKILAKCKKKRNYLSKNANQFINNYSIDSVGKIWRQLFKGKLTQC